MAKIVKYAAAWCLGWGPEIGASRVIVCGLCMIDTQLAQSGVEHNSQTLRHITEIRVGKTTTLKIANRL